MGKIKCPECKGKRNIVKKTGNGFIIYCCPLCLGEGEIEEFNPSLKWQKK